MSGLVREKCSDYSGEDPPVPIPNTEVKLLSADDTWRVTSREIRSSLLFLFFEIPDAAFSDFSCSVVNQPAPIVLIFLSKGL